jgi:hypothetical protein
MAFIATNTQLERYFRKEALGQAAVVANSETDITLSYHRFDDDTGARIDDEVLTVDYGAIMLEHANMERLIAIQQARVNTLAVVLAYLDGLLAGG